MLTCISPTVTRLRRENCKIHTIWERLFHEIKLWKSSETQKDAGRNALVTIVWKKKATLGWEMEPVSLFLACLDFGDEILADTIRIEILLGSKNIHGLFCPEAPHSCPFQRFCWSEFTLDDFFAKMYLRRFGKSESATQIIEIGPEIHVRSPRSLKWTNFNTI